MGPALPDLTQLGCAIGKLLPGAVVVSRKANVRSSSFLTEVVTCRLPGGEELRLFCKYGTGAADATGYGHRGGVAYEALVYRDLLHPLGVRAAPFFGAHLDPHTGATWLVLGFQQGGRINKKLGLAARWIGEFQRAAALRFGDKPPAWLRRYDTVYYTQWAQRTRRLAAQLGLCVPWLPAVCVGFESVATDLLKMQPTVIHGEFYPCNVILHRDAAVPIDWESAAFGAGEIDLASLTEGWSTEDVDECVRDYAAARWPGGLPREFERAFHAARLYLDFRWLGEEPAQLADPESRWYLDDLILRGERLGLI
jgi:Phosphotransferase enzyme family